MSLSQRPPPPARDPNYNCYFGNVVGKLPASYDFAVLFPLKAIEAQVERKWGVAYMGTLAL